MSTARYNRDGISFQYPENWELEEDPPQGVPRTISVTAKDGAFWSATVYQAAGAIEELEKEYVNTFCQEYEEVELDPVQVLVGGHRLGALDLQFYCLDFLVHSRLIAQHIGDHFLLITWQAEDRDFDKLEQVFSAITFSALQN